MLIQIDRDRGKLFARVNPAVSNAVRRLEGQRKWVKAGHLSFMATKHNLDILMEALPDVRVERAVEPSADDVGTQKPPLGYPTTYVEKTPSYAHQTRAKDKGRFLDNYALFMEQGTGKSKVAIDLCAERYLRGDITAVLVVSPKGVHGQWAVSQIPTHCGIPHVAFYWQGKPPETIATPGQQLVFFCINIDAVRIKTGFNFCSDLIWAHHGKVAIILDEAHRIKNTSSASWKALNLLGRRARLRMALTGTPIAQNLSDEWAILKWLDRDIIGIEFITSFKNEYCILGGWDGNQIVAHRNVDKFKRLAAPHIFRATKEEIGILPKAYSYWPFDLAPAQKKIIKDLKQTLLAEIKGQTILAKNAAVGLMRIQQASNGFVQEGEEIHPIFDDPNKNPRIIAAKDWANSVDGPIVIWGRFKQDIRFLAEAFGDECVTYFGETSEDERIEAVRQFLGGEKRIFVSTPAAGGTGLNLQGDCQAALYYSNSDNSIDRWQSEDRIHRIGTLGAVVYTDLVGKGSIDQRILKNLAGKKAISEMALSDIEEILNEIE